MAENDSRLMVVSNRLPAKLQISGGRWRAERSSGGLATAMRPILHQSEGLWIGWPGNSAGIGDPGRQAILDEWEAKEHLIAVELPLEMARHYYEGYANQTLWPLFHYFPSRLAFDPLGWKSYVAANERFRDGVLRHYREGDLVWVHDYQLMLLPKLLRDALPQARIGFFLHIPFPSSEVFRILPERRELLEGLLGADLLAFQTHSHLQHFRNTLLRVLGRESRMDQVEIGSRAVRLEALPIGIAPDEFTAMLAKHECRDHLAALEQRYEGRQILLGVDRLDYTKGIPERLRTYRRLLEKAPHLRGKIGLVQVAVPSRERIFSYDALRRQVNELVGEINGNFSTPDWTPVVYMRRGISRAQLVALYSRADVAWVTPLRDGMNLVAKEYVACKPGGHGILLLSEFAGAAEDLGEAYLVNPYDEPGTAEVIERVLALPREQRRERIGTLRSRVVRHNVFAWSERFMSLLREAGAVRASEYPHPLALQDLMAAYAGARQRLLFLDYDGTLVPIASRAEYAVPSPELASLLGLLTHDPHNCVALVSGRRRADLDRWFGALSGLWLAAEHGALMRSPDSGQWESQRPDSSSEWMQRVRPVLEHFVDRTPGSFIEEKECSLVWHYRLSAPQFGDWLAHELVAMLEQMLAETELRAIRGHKTVEVKPLWINKGIVAERLKGLHGVADFQFAVGDDRTDEDLFAALDASAWTVHVGEGPSRARFSLADPARVRELLERLANRAS
jgi:trehalose 6-phosphate synthase/phosphatase